MIILLWIAAWGYISFNKDSLISKITTKLSKKTRGEATIGDLSASFFRTFPLVSLQLSDITIKDSMWAQHKQTFFQGKDVYLRLNPLSIFSGDPQIGKILVIGGALNLYSDSTFDNDYILRSNDTTTKKSSPLPDILLRNTVLIYQKPGRNKIHQFNIRKLSCDTKEENDVVSLDIKTDMIVDSLGFNTTKGVYLRNKNLKGGIKIILDRKEKVLRLPRTSLNIQGEPYTFQGTFSLDTTARDFNLVINSNKLNFQHTVGLLPKRLQEKLGIYKIARPIAASIDISGKMKFGQEPLVKIAMGVKNNKVLTPMGDFNDCTFTGTFINELDSSKPRKDFNSAIEFQNLVGKWESLPLRSKKIKISNLTKPYLECDLQSNFKLASLNELTGSTTLKFKKGTGIVNIDFRGPIAGQDSTDASIDGNITINNAAIEYIPRNFTFTNCNGNFRFAKKDLFVEKFSGRAGDTELRMNGDAKNFLSLLDISPEKMVLHWNVNSPYLHLKDFKTFLAKRKIPAEQKVNAKFRKTANKIDKMFTDGDVFITLTSPKMDYKKFNAENVDARVLLTQNRIDLKNASFGHADGTMAMSGVITEGVTSNGVVLNTRLIKMDIPKLFYSFADFGQDAVTHKNLNGIVSAQVNFFTAIDDKADVIPDSMNGTVDFLVQNGELKHFEPFEKIAISVFKKQDFSVIRFADLKNQLKVKGTAIIIDKMEIRSTALVLFVQGVYDVKKGTDMSIKFPIRNMIRKNDSIDLVSADIRHGVSVHVRAKTGDDGKLKISWDPFRRAVKNKKEADSN